MKLKEVISLEFQKDIYLVEEAEGDFTIDFSDEQSRKNKFESSYVFNKLASINKLATSHTRRESKTSDVGSTIL